MAILFSSPTIFNLRQLSGKLPLNYTVWALFTLWRQRKFWASKTLFCRCRRSVNELFQISILNQFMPHWFSSNLLDLTKMPSNRKNSTLVIEYVYVFLLCLVCPFHTVQLLAWLWLRHQHWRSRWRSLWGPYSCSSSCLVIHSLSLNSLLFFFFKKHYISNMEIHVCVQC